MIVVCLRRADGSEQRQAFEKREVTFGRGAGNDVVVSDGSVSKVHALLSKTAGGLVISDLGSKNGTLVNGVRIEGAVHVAPNDVISIGILEVVVETEEALRRRPPSSLPALEASEPDSVTMNRRPQHGDALARTGSAAYPVVDPYEPLPPTPRASDPLGGSRPASLAPTVVPPPPRLDQGGWPIMPPPTRLPAVPPPPTGRRGPATAAVPPPPPRTGAPPPPRIEAPPPRNAVEPPAARRPPPEDKVPAARAAEPSKKVAPGTVPEPPPSSARTPKGVGKASAAAKDAKSAATKAADKPAAEKLPAAKAEAPKEAKPPAPSKDPTKADADAIAHGEKILQYMTKVLEIASKTLKLEPFNKATPVPAEMVAKLDETLAAAIATAKVPAERAEAVRVGLRKEFLETGPLSAWLDDATITAVRCFRHDAIELVRGTETSRAPMCFTSSSAMNRAMLRLAKQSGREWAKGELVVERRFLNGSRLVALVPPLAASLSLTVRKRETVSRTMEGLLKNQVLSQPMSALLGRAMSGRANVFVVGTTERAAAEIVAGLLSAAPNAHRVLVLHAGLDVALGSKRGASQPLPVASEESAARAAALLGYEHTVSLSARSNYAAGAVLAMAGGGEGIVATFRERTLERGLTSIAGELVLSRAGLTLEAAHAVLAQGIDLAVFVSRTPDGMARVERLAELEIAANGSLGVRELYAVTQGDGKGFVFTPVNPPQRATLE